MYGRGQQQSNQICRFYQQGRCKFGDNCKYQHSGADSRPQQNQNSFAALNNNQNDGRSNARPSAPSRGDHYRPGGNADRQPVTYGVTKENVAADLVNEKPQWPFSAYGPGRDAPRQLFGFPLEQSFEEMRVMHYLAEAQGNVQSSIQSHQELFEKSQQQVQQVLNDLDGAVQYILAGKDEHPNRIDMCQSPLAGDQPPPLASFENPVSISWPSLQAPTHSTANSPFAQQPSLGANAPKPRFGTATQSGVFGQPSALGQPNTFGQPSAPGQAGAFGQPSNLGQAGAFGQPSNLGQAGGFSQAQNPGQAGAFGQPSNLGQAGAFGQPSNLGQAGAFGKPSNLGQTGAFGQPPNLGQTGAFGQPSNLGQAGAFGQPSNLGQAGAFGKPSNLGQAGPFGQSSNLGQTGAFGQPSNLGQTGAFGQPSNLGQQQGSFAQANAQPGSGSSTGFGQPSAPGSQGNASTQSFGQSSFFAQGAQNQQNKPNPFAQAAPTQQQSNPFGQKQGASQTSGFGAQNGNSSFAQGAANQSPFGQPHAPNPQTTAQSAFGQPSQQDVNGTVSSATPDPSTYITRNANNTLQTWKNKRVTYMEEVPYSKLNDGTWQRIFHPDGPPARKTDIEDRPEAYNAALEAAYAFVRETGTFKNGFMPEVPPKMEWITFDV